MHAYDDAEVICSQGTISREILDQCQPLPDVIFVPVGGGGLIAGISVYLKQVLPQIWIIGVESEDSACLEAALKVNKPVPLAHVGLFADGVAVKTIGDETFRLARQFVDEVVTVSADEICAAVKDIFDDCRSVAEPAGALALAGLKTWAGNRSGEPLNLLAILSGANINFHQLRHISERAALGEKRETVLATYLPETPGSFLKFCEALGERNITEFNYRYNGTRSARVYVGIELDPFKENRHDLIANLESQHYNIVDLSDDEVAKLHIRHMVGGQAEVINELILRVEFAERQGALAHFLNTLGNRWNITLFHYRNHGAAYGRVLLGLQITELERQFCLQQLEATGFHFTVEKNNPAYRLFLTQSSVEHLS